MLNNAPRRLESTAPLKNNSKTQLKERKDFINTDRVGKRKGSMNYQRPSPARDNYFTTKAPKTAKGTRSSRTSIERTADVKPKTKEVIAPLTSRSGGGP